MTKENKELVKFRTLAEGLQLKFINEYPLLPTEPVLAIVNKRSDPPSLKVVSRNKFAKEHKFTWVDTIFGKDQNEGKCQTVLFKYGELIEEARQCEKALLETDYGLALINLSPIKKGQTAVIYEGEYKREKYSLGFVPNDSKKYIDLDTYLDGNINVTVKYFNYSKEIKNTLLFNNLPSEGIKVLIDADKFRGFGSYLQSLIEPEALCYYQFNDEDKRPVALTNLLSPYNEHVLPVFKAMEDIPPLSLLGFSYGLKYFMHLEIPSVPFSKNDGFSISYEIAKHEIRFIDESFLIGKGKEYYYSYSCTLSKQDLEQKIDTISEKGVSKFGFLFLKEAEKKQIINHMSKKHIRFDIVIKSTPDILIMKAAYLYYNVPYPAFLEQYAKNEKSMDEFTQFSHFNAEKVVFYDRVKFISESKRTDTETSIWFQYFENQHLYFSALESILDCIQKYNEDKSSPEEKIKKVENAYSKLKTGDYPLLLRNIVLNAQIKHLWCLIKEKEAKNYINASSSSNKKTPLHLALDSKDESKKLATCLLLLEFKADPHLKDTQGRSPYSLVKNNALTFLFKRMETGSTDPDKLGIQIAEEARNQGFGGRWKL